MNFTKSYLIFYSLFLIFSSCSSEIKPYYQEENGSLYVPKGTLKETSTKKFRLDSASGFYYNSIDFNVIENKNIYSTLNPRTNSIMVYNYLTGDTIKKIEFQSSGLNSVGKLDMTSYHHIINFDSILVYNTKEGNLYFLNDKGKLFNKIKLINIGKDKISAVPYASLRSPMIIIGKYIYVPCEINMRRNQYSNFKSVLRINLIDHSKSYIVPMSDAYDNGHWGAYFKYHVTISANDNNHIIVNYPIDPFIYSYDLNNLKTKERYFVGSEKFGVISPMNKDIDYGLDLNQSNSFYKKERQHSLSTNDYSGIYYDKYKDIYYRFALIRPSLDMVKKGKINPQVSIIVCDNKFNKLCETTLSNDYDGSMFFINENGLHISKHSEYLKNENQMVYGVFTFKD